MLSFLEGKRDIGSRRDQGQGIIKGRPDWGCGGVGGASRADDRYFLLVANTEAKVECRWNRIKSELFRVNEALTLGFIPDGPGHHH